MTVYASFNVGATWTRYCIADDYGVVASGAESTILAGEPSVIPARLRNILVDGLNLTRTKKSTDIRVGIDFAGLIEDVEGEIRVTASNICGGLSNREHAQNDWIYIPITSGLKGIASLISVRNDVVAEALVQREFGSLRDCDFAAYINWGSGVGFAILINGKVVKGRAGRAGHGGHQIVTDDLESRCGCGNIGDIESIAGGISIATRYGRSAGDVFSSATAGDRSSIAICDRAIEVVSRGIFNTLALFDLELVCIGGAVFNNNSDYILPILHTKMASYSQLFQQDVRIVRANPDLRFQYVSGFVGLASRDQVSVWIQALKISQQARVTRKLRF